MDFEKRLQKAIQRGNQSRSAQNEEKNSRVASEEDLRGLHAGYRVDLADHIEKCLSQLSDHFPGFDYNTVLGENGWGARIIRDDIDVRARKNLYSRLEMVVEPFSSSHIVSLAAKGTIRNREVLNRSHYQFIAEADTASFIELIDLWILEFAEKFAATA